MGASFESWLFYFWSRRWPESLGLCHLYGRLRCSPTLLALAGSAQAAMALWGINQKINLSFFPSLSLSLPDPPCPPSSFQREVTNTTDSWKAWKRSDHMPLFPLRNFTHNSLGSLEAKQQLSSDFVDTLQETSTSSTTTLSVTGFLHQPHICGFYSNTWLPCHTIL